MDAQVALKKGKNKQFTFDKTCGQNSTQESVYERSAKHLVAEVFKGFNVTVLAYGQTGSGKTHTMGTNFHANNSLAPEDLGVIPRVCEDVFKKIEALKGSWKVTVKVAMSEIYNNNVKDLLCDPRYLLTYPCTYLPASCCCGVCCCCVVPYFPFFFFCHVTSTAPENAIWRSVKPRAGKLSLLVSRRRWLLLLRRSTHICPKDRNEGRHQQQT